MLWRRRRHKVSTNHKNCWELNFREGKNFRCWRQQIDEFIIWILSWIWSAAATAVVKCELSKLLEFFSDFSTPHTLMINRHETHEKVPRLGLVNTELWIFPWVSSFLCARWTSLRMLPGLPRWLAAKNEKFESRWKLLKRANGILVCIWFISHFLLLSLIDDYRIGSFFIMSYFLLEKLFEQCRKLRFSNNK